MFESLIVVSMLTAAALPVDPTTMTEDEFWQLNQSNFAAIGFDRPRSKVMALWLEGQYLLGTCRDHAGQANIAHWRNWWSDTPLMNYPFGRYLLKEGEKLFASGGKAALSDPPSAELCAISLTRWYDDMERADTLVEIRHKQEVDRAAQD